MSRKQPARFPRQLAQAGCLLGAALASVWLAVGQRAAAPTDRPPPPSPHAAAGVRYDDVTVSAGMASFRHVSGTPEKDYILDATGSGCAFLDYDNDGWQDAYLVNGSTYEALEGRTVAPRAALFRNNGNGTFTDVTTRAGVSNQRWGQGVGTGDYDNDGWQDIYVTNYGKNRLYHNNGDGTFTDVAEKAGVSVDSWTTGCAFGDYDGDGRLDLFVAGYVRFDLNKKPPPARPDAAAAPAGPAAADRPAAAGMGASYSVGASYCQYRGQRVMCGPRGLEGARDYLFRNNGDGTFSEVSVRAGVADPKGLYGFGVAWFDSDDDGRLDLFVANDSTPNYLYRNRGDGTFDDVSYSSGTALNESGREQAHMGVAIGDYDNDGRDDIHITNFADDSNVLYHNDDGKNFSDVTFLAGLGEITIPFLGWGTNFFDYDNDGWLDLFVANGHVYPAVDAAGWNTSYRQRALLFRNLKTRFAEIGSSGGAGLTKPRPVRGSAVADYDNDGDMDILLNNIDDAPALLRNDGGSRSGHWLELRLIGDVTQRCPRDAIGSVVFCTANGVRMRGEVASGRGQVAQSDLRVHFGLGPAEAIEKLEVRWANGPTVEYKISKVDSIVVIDQSKPAP
ncbi:MAG: CRTAC1 family protein [Acidobacteriota bacterium]